MTCSVIFMLVCGGQGRPQGWDIKAVLWEDTWAWRNCSTAVKRRVMEGPTHGLQSRGCGEGNVALPRCEPFSEPQRPSVALAQHRHPQWTGVATEEILVLLWGPPVWLNGRMSLSLDELD